jgi:hypothetical protein
MIKLCSDFDNDCDYIKDPFDCWLGKPDHEVNGVIYYTPIADGYCPLCRHTKEAYRKEIKREKRT